MNVVFDRLPEVRIGTIFAAYFFERPLPLGGVEPLCKRPAFAAFIALPQVGRRVVVDHPGDIDGQRVKRIDAVACCGVIGAGSLPGRRWRALRASVARSASQEIGKPAAVAAFAVVLAARERTERGWAGAPRRRAGDITRRRLRS